MPRLKTQHLVVVMLRIICNMSDAYDFPSFFSVSQPVGVTISIYNMNRLLSHGHNNLSHMAIKGYKQSYYDMTMTVTNHVYRAICMCHK